MTDPKPFPSNPVTTVVNQGIDGVFGVAVKAAEAAIIAQVPILGTSILNRLLSGVVNYVANKIYQQFALWVSFEIIDFQTRSQVNDSKKALTALKAAQKSGDPNAIHEALEAFALATAHLTHINGSSDPGSL